MTSKKSRKSKTDTTPKALGLFDHVKHIRSVQSPGYYDNLSETDRKSFNHFMIIRTLAMDDSIIEDMAVLYRYFDKIPSPQFYQLLISVVPKSNKFVLWIKSKYLKHNKDLLELVSKKFEVPKRQANEYVNILLHSNPEELVNVCRAYGLEDKEIEELVNKDNKYD